MPLFCFWIPRHKVRCNEVRLVSSEILACSIILMRFCSCYLAKYLNCVSEAMFSVRTFYALLPTCMYDLCHIIIGPGWINVRRSRPREVERAYAPCSLFAFIRTNRLRHAVNANRRSVSTILQPDQSRDVPRKSSMLFIKECLRCHSMLSLLLCESCLQCRSIMFCLLYASVMDLLAMTEIMNPCRITLCFERVETY